MNETRLTGQERRCAIVSAALPLFARKGFANTTTRELAEAAGVSEALLYKHFPSKELLYTEIQAAGCQESDPALEKLAKLEPSTSTLVRIIYYLFRSLVFGRNGDPIPAQTKLRMLLNSCLEDGEFTRLLFENRFSCCFDKVQASIASAEALGDIVKTDVCCRNRIRFSHHVAAMIAIMHLPPKPAIDYQTEPEDLVRQAIWFVLRGLGLTDRAIERYYQPQDLARFFEVTSG
jgi:AcrR family transcriptional regulator